MTHICRKVPQNKRFHLRPIHGNCLEKLGIRNEGGGYAIIDSNATAKVGDVVFCCKISGQIGGYIKQIKEINGDSIIVGTAYCDESKDFTFEAEELRGVVIETYGKLWGTREYVRPTHLRKKTKTRIDKKEMPKK